MNPIVYWTCKILTFGMFQEGDSIDFPTLMIMLLAILGIFGVIGTIITYFSDKSDEQDPKARLTRRAFILTKHICNIHTIAI